MSRTRNDKPPVLLPRYEVSDAEWAAVPATVPDRLLRWGTLLPYYGLLGAWIGLGSPSALLVALAFWGFFTVFSARLTPWLVVVGLAGASLAGPGGPLFAVALWISACWCLALALVAAVTGIRLTLAVRRWRGQAAGPVTVFADLLAGTGTFSKVGNKIFSLGAALLVVALVKLGIAITSDTVIDPRNLVRTLDLETGSFMVPLLGLAFWLLASTVRWVLERISGDVVLEIPMDPGIGPVSFARAVNAVERSEAGLEGCSCGAKARAKGGELPPVLALDDGCTRHGIEAVNALDSREFQAVANEVWVWGKNAGMLSVPVHKHLSIVGLHGWGSTPMALGTPAAGKDPDIPTHTGYRPWRVRETTKREARVIRWRDIADVDPNFGAEPEREHEPLDRIRLDAVSLPGFALRTESARPRFETNPAPVLRRGVQQPQTPEASVSSTPSR